MSGFNIILLLHGIFAEFNLCEGGGCFRGTRPRRANRSATRQRFKMCFFFCDSIKGAGKTAGRETSLAGGSFSMAFFDLQASRDTEAVHKTTVKRKKKKKS